MFHVEQTLSNDEQTNYKRADCRSASKEYL